MQVLGSLRGSSSNQYPDINGGNISEGSSTHSALLGNRRQSFPRGVVEEASTLQEETTSNITSNVLLVLEKYRLHAPRGKNQPLCAVNKFVSQIKHLIAQGEPISMVLPAFPFKSANKTTKVLGALPDKGEEMALKHLNNMCQEIGKYYKNGAQLYIVSDGLVYNGVSDEEVWRYGQALRQLAREQSCDNIGFSRLSDLLNDDTLPEPLSEAEYVKYAPRFREQTLQRYLPRDFDVVKAITNDPDINSTYCGYVKFLNLELADTLLKDQKMTTTHKIRCCKQVARHMITRGKAFADAILHRFPEHIRLSIHASTDTKKISVSLIPQTGSLSMTPWHSALVYASDGSISMQHAGTVSTATHILVREEGQPYYFREDLPTYAASSSTSLTSKRPIKLQTPGNHL
ncbi:hypothetical protein MGYG_02078 [Nannizzia gypsea CBS 118893]|uniref:Pyoverdine/dityrosine biosynthesis protein n=1 Tax=Arthroderma gypseum (strain ATCC MYA-4604 / CBS 118893) TaxID=535722 RepID=E4UPM8_ARTGP|nr:hypothetical protein MGYG_02078 [Nannizzia gypsea CBS 118893]EFQ99065.1 hypothetical protein MGYG_02078 [Nannizzia gypsea CBS 118893]